jgi:hypothetical protein
MERQEDRKIDRLFFNADIVSKRLLRQSLFEFSQKVLIVVAKRETAC